MPRQRSERIIRFCLECGTTIVVTKATARAGRGIFCSRACSARFHHTGRPKPKSKQNIIFATAAIRGKHPHNWRPPIAKVCQQCGSTFNVPSYRESARYCSHRCSSDAKMDVYGPTHPLWTRVQKQCEFCGAIVWVKPAKLHEFRFCSRQCQGAHLASTMAEKKGPTSIELALMKELDARLIPYRKQHQIAHWLIDITLPEHRIAIECDGDYWHSSPKQKQKDANKDSWLIAHKWRIFRFLGSEILASPQRCIDTIVKAIH